jgi:hypothetical protein
VWKSNSNGVLIARKLLILLGDERDRMDERDSLGTIWYKNVFGGGVTRDENLEILRERIQASFERARQQPPAPKPISEEDRLARVERYAAALMQAALRKVK